MTVLSGKQCFVTGVTSGIGKAVVKKLIDEGATVVGVGRRQEALEKLEADLGNAFVGLAMDVTDKSEWEKVSSKLSHQPDIVILNAGNCEYIDDGNVDSELVKRVFEVNFFANVYAAEFLLPKLVEAGSLQHWSVVSSSAAFMPLPRSEAYGSSKAALDYFYESLAINFPSVRFSLVHPGFVKTPLTDKNDFDMPMRISAEEAANSLVAGIKANKREINFPTVFTFILKRLGRLPAALRFKISSGMKKQ